jgi:RNA polymerase sigma-70 factor (ECF subfamily)
MERSAALYKEVKMAGSAPTQVSKEGWEAIYRASFARVYRALVATVLDRELALDALQEAFVRGLEHPPFDRNVEGWLFTVALHEAGRTRRRLARLARTATSVGQTDHVRQLLDRLELGELLQTLTQRQRAIMLAHYFLDMTQEEIASAFGIRRGTVGATIAHALERMREEATHVL